MRLCYAASILQPEHKRIKPLLTCTMHSSPITHSASSDCFTTPFYFELTTNNLVGQRQCGSNMRTSSDTKRAKTLPVLPDKEWQAPMHGNEPSSSKKPEIS